MSTSHDTLAAQAEKPTPSPADVPDASSLCERCRLWDGVVDPSQAPLWANWREGVASSLDEMLREKTCLVCRVVTQAVQNGLNRRLKPDSTSDQVDQNSTITIVNYGPLFLDGLLSHDTRRWPHIRPIISHPYKSGTRIREIGSLDPDVPILHIGMKLEVLVDSCSSDADSADIVNFEITPRLCAIYCLSP